MKNKKTIIIYILKLFENIIDENLPMTQTTIAKVLGILGIECDRKTVGRNIRYLTQIGCPIKKHKSGGYYFDKKETWDLWSVNERGELKKYLILLKQINLKILTKRIIMLDKERELDVWANVIYIYTKKRLENDSVATRWIFDRATHDEWVLSLFPKHLASERAYNKFFELTGKDIRDFDGIVL